MARLENRERTLIVLDDVWEQSVVQHLHISHKSIKYLITTQNSNLWPDVVRSVPIANPTPEEAKWILANHIVGWVLDESFPPEVQEEVDRLVLEVDRNPFILATIATSVTSKGEAMDPQTWKELRRNLVATLKQLPVDDSAGPIMGENDVNCPLILKALESFSRILMEDFKPEVQSEAIRGLGMLAARPDIREILIVGYQGALKRSVELLTETSTTSILNNVRDAVDLISAKGPNPEDLDEVTADFRSATLRGYVAILRDDVPIAIQLQLAASRALSELLLYKDNRRLFSLACPDGLKSLKCLVDREDQSSSDWPLNCRFYASVALTLIDPSEGSELKHSAEGYFGRGRGQMLLGMFEKAVVNFDKAIRMVLGHVKVRNSDSRTENESCPHARRVKVTLQCQMQIGD